MKSKYIYITFSAACLQNVLCSGVIFGWSAISETLLVDRIHGPGLSQAAVQTIYTMACMSNLCSCLPLGILMDWRGPRLCNVFSAILVGAGALCCSLSNQSNSEHYFLYGMLLIAFGGTGLQISVMHISNLFPTAKGITTAVFTGCFNASYAVFLVFNMLWETTDISYNAMFFGYSVVSILCGLLGAFLFPDVPYELDPVSPVAVERVIFNVPGRSVSLPDAVKYDSISSGSKHRRARANTLDNALHANLIRKPSSLNLKQLFQKGSMKRIPTEAIGFKEIEYMRGQTSNFELKRGSLVDQLRSIEFLRMMIFVALGLMWANFHIGFTGTILGDQNFLTSNELKTALQFFVLGNLLIGGLTTPIFGMIADKFGYLHTVVLGFSCGILYCFCFLSKNSFLLYVGFVVFPCYTTFQMCYFFIKLGDDMGYRFFGILTGLISFTAGLANFFQGYLSQIGSGSCHVESSSSCTEGNWTALILIELAFYVVMLVLLAMVEIQAKKRSYANDDVVGLEVQPFDIDSPTSQHRSEPSLS
mmetsp:Transcript_10460/g.13663  ORF Transcript_10460/g.13663 Transcript_10460/m.13663 type:complete len:532 (-) Transcript_10460:60-1655(-)